MEGYCRSTLLISNFQQGMTVEMDTIVFGDRGNYDTERGTVQRVGFGRGTVGVQHPFTN